MTDTEILTAVSGAETKRIENLYLKIYSNVTQAKNNVIYTVNTEMVKAYWKIGRDIVEEEEHGKARANYGKLLIETISKKLTNDFGKGFSATNLRLFRKFYLRYPIQHTLCGELQTPDFNKNLSWSHYRTLCQNKISHSVNFYEQETIKNRWSVRELQRQMESCLFERLLKSKDKEAIIDLCKEGQQVTTAEDVIKDPVVLEFLGLPESHKLVESKLEDALISKLQDFILELGKGFAFVGRQQRISLEGDHFYIDLVFYHTILKCYVLIDIKTAKLNHGDLGQMLTYVNYYDFECLHDGDNPTVGLILCTEKNSTMVKYTLGDRVSKIFASKYKLHLPTVEELEAELKRELEILDNFVTAT